MKYVIAIAVFIANKLIVNDYAISFWVIYKATSGGFGY